MRIVERDGEATALLADLQAARCVWIIDAARSGAPPGTIHRIDCATTDAIVPRGTVSSHGFGVAEAIALARALGTLPPHCIVYAIEAADFTPGAEPSPAVTQPRTRSLNGSWRNWLLRRRLHPADPPHPAPATDRR